MGGNKRRNLSLWRKCSTIQEQFGIPFSFRKEQWRSLGWKRMDNTGGRQRARIICGVWFFNGLVNREARRKSRRIFLTVSPTFTVDRDPRAFYEPWRESTVAMCKPWAFSTVAPAFEALLFFRPLELSEWKMEQAALKIVSLLVENTRREWLLTTRQIFSHSLFLSSIYFQNNT